MLHYLHIFIDSIELICFSIIIDGNSEVVICCFIQADEGHCVLLNIFSQQTILVLVSVNVKSNSLK